MKLQEVDVIDTFYAAKQMRSLNTIYKIVNCQKENMCNIDETSLEIDIIMKIRHIANEIYSGCEIINEMMIAVYRNDDRYRGKQLKNGFNGNLKEVCKASLGQCVNDIYKDEFIYSFYNYAKRWYVEIHDIRTQEVHYNVGRIEIYDGQIYYVNGNRNGASKEIYSNPSNEIRIELKVFLGLINDFLATEGRVAKFIKDASGKTIA